MRPRTVLIVEDEPNARIVASRAVSEYLFSVTDSEHVEILVADSVASARRLLPSCKTPLWGLIDLGLPDGWGHEVVQAIRTWSSDAQLIVSTVFDDDANLLQALQAGANGYVLKDGTVESVLAAVRAVAEGRPPLSPPVARRLLAHFTNQARVERLPVTSRELEVVRLLARGFTNADVASALGISVHTVSTHVKTVYRKLHISSRAELTLILERSGHSSFGVR